MQDVGYLNASGLSKAFATPRGPVTILDGFDLNIKKNEFVCVMGTSGCGKSTLMRMLEGIETPDAGTVALDGATLPSRPSKAIQRRIGIVFQQDNLLDWRSVYANVMLPLTTFGLAKGEDAERRIMDALELVGLGEFRDCLPQELSGGMRQRCAIARALVSNPDLLMLDQPFGALDAITRRMLNVQLMDIWHRTKTTCVMVTNSVNEALYLAQRIIVLDGSPARVAHDIAVPFTYEERAGDLTSNERYLAMREDLTRIVHSLH